MAAKVCQIYGFSIDEAMKLSPEKVLWLEDFARRTAEEMYLSSPEFQQALRDKLAPVTHTVRGQLETDKGGPAGPPPGG